MRDEESVIDKVLGKEVFRIPVGNGGRGTPVKSGALLMLGVLIAMVIFGVIPSVRG